MFVCVCALPPPLSMCAGLSVADRHGLLLDITLHPAPLPPSLPLPLCGPTSRHAVQTGRDLVHFQRRQVVLLRQPAAVETDHGERGACLFSPLSSVFITRQWNPLIKSQDTKGTEVMFPFFLCVGERKRILLEINSTGVLLLPFFLSLSL